MEKRKRQKKKLPRILVEWICSKCDLVHRISFPVSVKSSLMPSYKIIWGYKNNIKRLELNSGCPLSKINQVLTSVIVEKFDSKGSEYVKISYPEKLFEMLKMNEETSLKHKRFYEIWGEA